MRAGSLDKKVIIEKQSEGSDDFGEVTNTWESYASTYVSILPLRGREYFSSKGVKSEVSHKIELRYMDGIDSSMRIVYGARVFEIESVINIREKNKTLEIMATEVV